MKRALAISLSVVACAQLAFAQPAKVSAGPTNSPAKPLTSEVSTNKPDIKELIKGDIFTNSIGMIMVKVGGMFAGRFLVTQEEYRKVTSFNPSQFQGDRNPVDSVSWNDARGFCSQLNDLERREEMLPDGFTYTIPTQAQWDSFAAGVELDTAITSADGNRAGTSPVGSLAPSAGGLYDTRGNLWQFCLDPEDKAYRVLRGGAWNSWIDVNLRRDFRWYCDGPDERKNTFGFRCVLVPSGEAK